MKEKREKRINKVDERTKEINKRNRTCVNFENLFTDTKHKNAKKNMRNKTNLCDNACTYV